MYDASNVAERIKKTAIRANIQLKDMFLELKLNKNTMSNMYNGSMLKANSLARIADYLGCSVDYLLGRSDIINISNNDSSQENDLTAHEKLLLSEYRRQVSMQLSVDKLLGIDNNAVEVLKIARGTNSEPVKFKSDISDLQNAHMTDEDF